RNSNPLSLALIPDQPFFAETPVSIPERNLRPSKIMTPEQWFLYNFESNYLICVVMPRVNLLCCAIEPAYLYKLSYCNVTKLVNPVFRQVIPRQIGIFERCAAEVVTH